MSRARLARAAPRAVNAILIAQCLVLLAYPLQAAGHAQRPRPRPMPREGPAPVFDLPLAAAPLDTPLVVTGGFGEYRVGHFHAGFDFSTGGVTGKRVAAPLAGHIERIRTSGVGYGRSLYLRTLDGRTIQFGHLDAFVEPIASWVRAIQDSSGQYEQDLWPAATRFPIAQGQPIAWTGQSGAGGPHMHFEIRRGDMAYQPMRAGLRASDDSAPVLVSLTLEPLDDTSYVQRGAAPYTVRLGASAETLSVIGRVRAVVGSRDGVWKGVDRMQPWLTRMDWDGQWVEARFDSVSWATDMVESDYVYDTGRVAGEKGIVMWAPREWRPRVIRASAPLAEEAGTIVMRPNDHPKTLVLSARDVAGNRTEAKVVLRAPKPGRGGPDRERVFQVPRPRSGSDRFEIAALPDGFLRVTYRGRKADSSDVEIGFGKEAGKLATPGDGGWVTIFPPRALQGGGRLALARHPFHGVFVDESEWELTFPDFGRGLDSRPAFDVSIPADSRFDRAAIAIGAARADSVMRGNSELLEGSPGRYVGPESEPLRVPLKLRFEGTPAAHRGVCRLGADGWEWLGGTFENGSYRAETRRLGWFALFSDTLAPRIGAPASAGSRGGPYPRWAIEASLDEHGSGVDARASWIEFDGRRVPSEWDTEAGVLRWRPAARPDAGGHGIEVVAADRAGNARRRRATLVLD